MLAQDGHSVSIIDWFESAFERLPDDFPGVTVAGNAVDQDVLIEAGIREADAFVAATSGDNRNIMASQVVKGVFGVPRVISRIKDPSRAEIYQDLGIEVDCRTVEGAEILLDFIEN
jgi:trk system potassium uptake protein TrkA